MNTFDIDFENVFASRRWDRILHFREREPQPFGCRASRYRWLRIGRMFNRGAARISFVDVGLAFNGKTFNSATDRACTVSPSIQWNRLDSSTAFETWLVSFTSYSVCVLVALLRLNTKLSEKIPHHIACTVCVDQFKNFLFL